MAGDVRDEFITAAAVSAARQAALARGTHWLAVLEAESGLEPTAWLAALGRSARWPVWPGPRLMGAKPDFATLPYPECRERECALVSEGGARALVFCDPLSEELQAWADARIADAGGPPVVDRALVHRGDLDAFLTQHAGSLRATGSVARAGDAAGSADDDDVVEVSLEAIGAEGSAVVSRVNGYLHDAIRQMASDIHLRSDAQGMEIKFRLDGVLVPAERMNGREQAERVISRIKVMSNLDIAERRVPQDGRFRARLSGAAVDFRVSIMPSSHGEDAVLRLLDRRALATEREELRLDKLGLDATAIGAFRRMAAHPYGLVLVTGPTGSGKTTTLYAAINEINSGRDNIVTIEDPVEYELPGVLQIPVNEKKGLTFARGLRSILRHDPDKILVGEIRDEETAQIAVQAALTGHVVFTTVHANNVFDVLGRFLHMGVDPYGLASSLVGIWAQRLVRVNCSQCSRDAAPGDEELAESGLGRAEVTNYRFRAGVGCPHCRYTGFRGRRAVAEYVHFTDALRELVVARQSVAQLRAEAQRTGLRGLRDAALHVVAQGQTTLQEINRVTFAS